MTAEYRSANPDVAPAEAVQRAKALESAIFGAATEIDYHHQCNEVLAELRRGAQPVGSSTTGGDEDSEDEYGTRSISHYKDARHLRDGLHSDVYKTSAPPTPTDSFVGVPGASVAVKVTYLIGMTPPHNSEKEVRVLGKITHSNIIPLWESFHEPGYSHLVLVFPFMPYTLDMILRQGYIAEAHGCNFLHDLFKALKHVHGMGIIHRDIKPSNILMKSPSGPTYLADFGIVWDPDDSASEPVNQKITDVGTASYRAPEVLFGRADYDQSLDIWAAGCVASQVVASSSKPLFDSGDLGSDLALIQSIFRKLGTPNSTVWPDAQKCPDWGKIQWIEYEPKSWSELLPGATEVAKAFVSELVVYQGSLRLNSQQALQHPFFAKADDLR